MNILEKIAAYKRQEVETRKSLRPEALLRQSIYYETPKVSLSTYLKRKDKVGIIAELKRQSPSQGTIHASLDVEQVSIGYMQAGASALSVLTDAHFFGGGAADLTEARRYNYCPILRKDFIVDSYQLVEAKSIGSDAILLIAAMLTPSETKTLARIAKGLDLEVLLEIHEASELAHLNEYIDLVGVNNRNLKDFSVSLEPSMSLISKLPKALPKISESGLSCPEDVHKLREAGFDGFLMGTHFMRHAEPHRACARFIEGVKACRSM